MDEPEPPLVFEKSSYSTGGEGNCVEIAFRGGKVYVRDSKDPDGGMIEMSAAGYRTLLAGVRNGDIA